MKRARRRRGLPALLSVLLLCCAQAAQAQVAVDTLARDPRLLALAGWQDAPLRPWRTRNVFTDRRATHDELASRRRFVADNLDLYVHDPRYACRRPALARWFHDRLQHPPLATAQCDPALPFVRADGSDAPLLRLDPARVYAVDYLLAEGNAQPMSRWGHSMLRLVVCAPGRAPGPDCRLDLGEHVVLSFRAFVDDVQVSSWRGLTGSYPSRLFVLPLAQVVTEYTEIELRGLRSIPLQLSRAEIAGLLQRAAQVHWAYDGRYAFIGNNCAVETARLLQDGVPRLAGAHLMSITPTGLLRRLERAGIADDSVLDDRAEAVRLGYSFEAADAHQAEIFAVARERLALPAADAAAWLDQPAARRGGACMKAAERKRQAPRAARPRCTQAPARRRPPRGGPRPPRTGGPSHPPRDAAPRTGLWHSAAFRTGHVGGKFGAVGRTFAGRTRRVAGPGPGLAASCAARGTGRHRSEPGAAAGPAPGTGGRREAAGWALITANLPKIPAFLAISGDFA